MISEEDFENNILSFDGRKVISSYFNEKLKENINYKNKKYTVEKAIELELKDIKKIILNEWWGNLWTIWYLMTLVIIELEN